MRNTERGDVRKLSGYTIKRLRSALFKFGAHRSECGLVKVNGKRVAVDECTCGFVKALKL